MAALLNSQPPPVEKVVQNHESRHFPIPHYAISPLSQFLGDIVALIDDKVLIEDLEDLAALKICHFVAASFQWLLEESRLVRIYYLARR